MAITSDSAVHVGTSDWCAGCITGAVSSCVTSNDCVFQSHTAWTNANATPRTFGNKTWRLVSPTLINTGVAGLSIVKTQRAVLHIDGGGVAVSYRPTNCKAASTVHPTVKSAISLSTVAAIATNGEVVGKGRGVDSHRSAISKDGASASTAAVASVVCAQTSAAES